MKISCNKQDLETNNENMEEIVKGISTKNFIKEYYFALPIDNVVPKIENGILTIEIFVKEPESSIKTIEIK